MGFLAGKKALIVGIASNRSIAYGIAQAMHREGAELAFSYANDKLKPRVEKFAAEFGSDIVLPCDVSSDAEITDLFKQLATRWGSLDALVHSVAFAPREALAGDYLENVQLGTGGWENYPGGGENNEVTGEALWGASTAVPEPSTLILLAVGAIALFAYSRRRRRSARRKGT